MAEQKVMRRRGPRIDIRRMVTDWLGLRAVSVQFGAQADELKVLMRDTLLPEQGDVDEYGHTWYSFDEPVEDPSGEGDVTGIKREKKVKKVLNTERAEEFLQRKGLWDECTETVVVINEEAILAANFEKVKGRRRISDRELNALYDVSESYAFVPQRRSSNR